MDAIILAGGYGSRLRSEISNIPKPIAPVCGKPFLTYLFEFLISQKINKIIISTFYKSFLIREKYKNSYKGIKINYTTEKEKLGTGGAINFVLKKNKVSDNILIINGDTYFDIDIKKLIRVHEKGRNDITIALKLMKNFDRYGIIEIGKKNIISNFLKKGFCKKGYIDGGMYLIKKDIFLKVEETSFSLNDFFIDNQDKLLIGYCIFDGLFIDIGVPEDYLKAQEIFKEMH